MQVRGLFFGPRAHSSVSNNAAAADHSKWCSSY